MLKFWKETRFLNHGITSIYTMMGETICSKHSRNSYKNTALTTELVKAALMKNGRKKPANIFASDSIITHIPHFVQQHEVLHFEVNYITSRR